MEKIGGDITGDGDAASTIQSQDSAQKFYNQFAILKGLPSLNETPVESFCTESSTSHFGNFGIPTLRSFQIFGNWVTSKKSIITNSHYASHVQEDCAPHQVGFTP